MNTAENRHTRRAAAGCIAILFALFFLLCLRAPYGFDWSDEPYYSVLPYRFVLGDRPLSDLWEVHQLSGLIALPFLRLFLLFSGGSTAGVLLYFRYVLLVSEFAIALYAFLSLRRRYGNTAALLSALLILAYAHYGLDGFSYNNLAPLFTVLSALLLFDTSEGRCAARKLLLSGMAYALAVQSQPYFLISLPVYAIAWGRSVRRGDFASGTGKARFRPFLLFLAGIFFAVLLFSIAVLTKTTPAEALAGIRGMLGDPNHTGTNVLLSLLQYCNAIRVLFGPAFLAAVTLTLYGSVVCFVKNTSLQTRLRQIGLVCCTVLVALAAVWTFFYDYESYHKINMAVMIPSLAVPALYLLTGRRSDRSLLLFCLGCALSVSVQLGSNTGIRASSGALCPASVGALLYLFSALDGAFDAMGQRRVCRALATASCALAVLITAFFRLTAVYRDAELPLLTAKITSGPAAGVVTTEERAALYDGFVRDLTENAPESGTILITNLMPVGYLCTGLSPATPSTFNMTPNSPWLAAYYEAHPDRVPDYAFAVDAAVGFNNFLSHNGAETLFSGYTATETPTGTAYRKVD